MHNEKEHIDDLLSGLLSDASMNAEGIDWNAFQTKRKRKRMLFWWLATAGIALLTLVSVLGVKYIQKDANDTISEVVENTNNVTQSEPQQLQKETIANNIDSSENEGKVNTTGEETIALRNTKSSESVSNNIANKPTTATVDQIQNPSVVRNPGFQLLSIRPLPYPKLKYTLVHQLANIPDTILIRPIDKTPPIEVVSSSFVKFGFGPSLINPSLKLGANAGNYLHKDYGMIRNAGEQNALGFHMSGMIGKQVKRWSPFIGLGLSHNAVYANYDFAYSQKPVRDIDGIILGYQDRATENIRYTSNHSYSMIDIPLGAEFELKRFGESRLNLIGQLSPQVLFSAQGNLPNAVFLNEIDVLSTADFKLNSITGYAGFSFSRKLGNMEWYIEPKYAYNFGLTQVKDLYNTRFNMIVVTFGIKK